VINCLPTSADARGTAVSESTDPRTESEGPVSDLSPEGPTTDREVPPTPAARRNAEGSRADGGRSDLTFPDGEVVPADQLDKIEILRGVALESVAGAIERCTVKVLEGGEMLVEPGSVDPTLYVVLSGRLAVLDPEGEAEDFLEVGRTVGEMAVLDRGPAPSAIQAHVDTRLLCIGEEAFWGLTWGSHDFAANVLAQMPRRVGGSGTAHADRVRQRPAVRDARSTR
jgi:hypothetical protein